MAPYAVHVRLDGTYPGDSTSEVTTTGDVGTWATINTSWDFNETSTQMVDDPRPSKSAQADLGTDQRGWNAAYFYTTSGTKTIDVTVWNEDGDSGTDQTTVSISANTRTAYHFATAGDDDTGDGSSGTPYQTWTKALTLLGDNVELRFNKGDTFSSAGTMNVSNDNVYLTTYGSGADPIIQATGKLFNLQGGENFVVQGLRCDPGTTTQNCIENSVSHSSIHNAAFVDCSNDSSTTGNHWYRLVDTPLGSANAEAEGLLMLRWDQSIGGVDACNASRQWGGQRSRSMVWHGNHLVGNVLSSGSMRPFTGDSGDQTPGCCTQMTWNHYDFTEFNYSYALRYQNIHFFHWSRSRTTKFNVIHLAYQDSSSRYFRIEGSYFDGTYASGNTSATILSLGNHLDDCVINNNVFDMNEDTLTVTSSNTRPDADPEDPSSYDDSNNLYFLNNTIKHANDGTNTKASYVINRASSSWQYVGLKVNNNCFIFPSSIDNHVTLSLTTEWGSANNAWPTVGGSTFQAGKQGESDRTYAQYTALSEVTNATRENLALADAVAPTFYLPSGKTADTHAVPADSPGVRYDYNDNVYNLAATNWSCGCAEGAFRA
jgi:hypothetical protein